MDLIDRQAAIATAISGRVRTLPTTEDGENWIRVNEVRDSLLSLPSAQPEQLGTNLAEVGTREVRGYPIDADALMEKVAEEYGERARDRLYQIIRYMPPTQPKRKTGKWLPDNNNNYYEERFICSVCGKSYKVDTCMGKPMWDFCPCGADMRGEQDESD